MAKTSKARGAADPSPSLSRRAGAIGALAIAVPVLAAGLVLFASLGGREQSSAVPTVAPSTLPFRRITKLSELPPEPADEVEVAYFHRTSRCTSCRNAERLTRKTVEAFFSEEVARGEVRLVVLNFQLPENEAVASRYDAYGPSLFLGVSKGGVQYIWEASDTYLALGDDTAFMAVLRDRINTALGRGE